MVVSEVITGKKESRLEYAAPLAMPKQLSSYAFQNACRNNHHWREIQDGSVT